ncbi:thiamine phosphate synthase [Brevifollis gellanilyticus]|uniref:Thiamine-phosphate synthase n=1 Tax=Brevifollis gellanilyticus TaxID=748831 RepID=A0A512M7N8_9BACT|nr:thiamine phosphate synthase [Brevifollis gellanilyticus]GEP42749.1 thiamine-phosphate synthase [Brevifollis gellanilyticus]
MPDLSASLQSLRAARLYGIVDLGYVKPENVVTMTRALAEGGVDILQLRAKGATPAEVESLARSMLPVTRELGVPLVINDHPEVAAIVGSEGVHVGQDDDSVAKARAIVGPEIFVGKSTHSLDQAVAAQAEQADYIGFGPLYATGTKPDYVPIGLQDITRVHELVSLPIFCIGGVNEARASEILQAGARRVVVVSAFLLASDVRAEVKRLKALLP